jgi:GNAT superfamily N-acetyltransferase
MEIDLRETDSAEDFSTPLLKNRATKPKQPITKYYVATSDGQEVGFVALDVPEDKSYLCIYELIVNPMVRRRGFGSEIVRKCYQMAKSFGCKKICLRPRPVEEGISEEHLISMYSGLGYKPNPEQNGLYEILL